MRLPKFLLLKLYSYLRGKRAREKERERFYLLVLFPNDHLVKAGSGQCQTPGKEPRRYPHGWQEEKVVGTSLTAFRKWPSHGSKCCFNAKLMKVV